MSAEIDIYTKKRLELAGNESVKSVTELVVEAEKISRQLKEEFKKHSRSNWIDEQLKALDKHLQTPSCISAKYLSDAIAAPFMIMAKSYYDEMEAANDRSIEKETSYKKFYDMHMGVRLISAPLESITENFSLKRSSNPDRVQESDEIDVGRQETQYLLNNIFQIQGKLYEEDKTGDKFIRETLNWIDGIPSRISPPFRTAFVLEVVSRGAVLAGDIYQSVYPEVVRHLMKDR